jgi:hypothetical protein
MEAMVYSLRYHFVVIVKIEGREKREIKKGYGEDMK